MIFRKIARFNFILLILFINFSCFDNKLPSKGYHNLFKELLGKEDKEIQEKIDTAWNQLFYGDDKTQRVYYPVEKDMSYIIDIGNNDVRSEGMSYGINDCRTT